MTLEKLLNELASELSILESLNQTGEETFSLTLNQDVSVSFRDLRPGMIMNALILNCPPNKKEDLFIFLMRANLLGQGTGGFCIGMDEGEKDLTLSSSLPYEMSYSTFKDKFEDFVNYLIYWREEMEKFKRNELTLL